MIIDEVSDGFRLMDESTFSEKQSLQYAKDFSGLYRSEKEKRIELEQIKEQLTQYSLELERKNKDLQDFAFIASHDLQEPLRKIISFGDRLESLLPNMDNRAKDYLDRMRKAAIRMRSFIDDLLQISRLESMAKSFEPTDLNETVKGALINLESRIHRTRGKVNIKDLPVIEADPLQMGQLFQNLIGNALKFHKERIPPLVNLDSLYKDKGIWEIVVEDNGIGIDEKYAERIFKPFERLHGKSEYEGTGMGLTICKKIVTRHGGDITLRSELKKGTKFIITLPEKQL